MSSHARGASGATGNSTLPTVTDVPPESSARSLWRGSVIQARRLLLGWSRDPATTIQSMVYPAVTLLMFRVVFGDSVSSYSGQPAVYGHVALITLMAAMTGSVVSGFGLIGERQTGLLSRFSTLPTHRAAGLLGRLFAEATRVLISTALIVGVGFALGFRFNQGIVAGIALLGLPVLFGSAFAVFVTAVATMSDAVLLVNVIGILNTLLLFFNSGFVPVHSYPRWMQGIVGNQPMSCAIEAMRGLSFGGPVATPLLKTLIWSVALATLFTYPAIRGLRRAVETS